MDFIKFQIYKEFEIKRLLFLILVINFKTLQTHLILIFLSINKYLRI